MHASWCRRITGRAFRPRSIRSAAAHVNGVRCCTPTSQSRSCSTSLPSTTTPTTVLRTLDRAASVTTSRVPPLLNPLSARVRDCFQKSPFRSPSPSAVRAAALDEILRLILTAPITPSPSPQHELHPLLCLRVIEELGYAVWSPCEASGTGNAACGERGGWLRRVQSYPSLTSGASLSRERLSRGPDSHTGRVTADPHSLALLCEHVTRPLLRLVQSRAANPSTTRPLPAAVRRALPVIFEWRCTLPTSPAVSSCLREWVPLLLDEAAREAALGGHSADQSAGVVTPVMPFRDVAPWLLRRILSQTQRTIDGDGAHDDQPSRHELVTVALSVDWVTRILRCVRGGEGTGTPVDEAALAELAFWSGPVPLLHHPLVRTGLAELLVGASHRLRAAQTTVLLPVPFSDDDALRRLLLRLSTPAMAEEDGAFQRTLSAKAFSLDNAVKVFVEPIFVPRAAVTSTGSPCGPEDDTPLRFIRPLHDYLTLATADKARSAQDAEALVQLSFAGCAGVLGAAVERLQQLRRQSSCNVTHNQRPRHTSDGTAGERDERGVGTLTLLPHKPRLHSLKSACELLLHDVRTQLAVTAAAPHAPPRPSDTRQPLFDDVPLAQQEAILRRLCGTARALVRVVMEEKRWSVAHEGAEGAALVAGGAERHTVAAAGTSNSRHEALGQVLRNAAHRVMEPALRVYYDATSYQAPPVQVTLDDLTRIFDPSSADTASGATPSPVRAGRAGAEWYVEALRDRYGAVYAALRGVDHVVGGRDAARRTALQLLHPHARSTESASLEAIRLLAVADLIVPAPRPPLPKQCMCAAESVDQGHTLGDVAEGVVREMDLMLNAFFSLWQHAARERATATGALDTAPTDRVALMHSLLLSVQLWLRRRCLWQPQLCADPHVVASWRSLEDLMIHHGEASPWAMVGLESLLPALQSRSDPPQGTSPMAPSPNTSLPFLFWPAQGGALTSFRSSGCVTGGDLIATARASLWEATEALDSVLETVRATTQCAVSSTTTTWHWLGSTAAVKEALRRLEDSARQTRGADSLYHVTTHFFLLPWSTVAWSRQPLAFYDEGGRSAAAADLCDDDLQRLLSFCRAGDPDCRVIAVVRLVTMPEELTLFSTANHEAETTIAEIGVRVVNTDVALEREVLALRQNLGTRTTADEATEDGSVVGLADAEYGDTDETDGLD